MSNFVVTGGAGFIGSNLVSKLLDLGHKVVVIDNFFGGKYAERLFPNAQYIEGSILDLELLQKVFVGIDGVFHMAAIPRMPVSIEKPIETSQVNIMGTLNVLVAARDQRVKKVVYSSSSSVYGNQPGKPPFAESLKTNPISPYGLQKFVGEEYVRLFASLYNLAGVSLRYFNVYGPFQKSDGAYASVVVKFLEQKKNGQKLTVCGDGLYMRDFTFVSDVVNANILAMENTKLTQGVSVNVGYGGSSSVLDLARTIGGEVEYIEERAGDIKKSEADITVARELLGWAPTVSLIEGVEIMKEYWRVN